MQSVERRRSSPVVRETVKGEGTYCIVVLEGAGREHQRPGRRNRPPVDARVADKGAVADAEIAGRNDRGAP
jgi:hypothetical protein